MTARLDGGLQARHGLAINDAAALQRVPRAPAPPDARRRGARSNRRAWSRSASARDPPPAPSRTAPPPRRDSGARRDGHARRAAPAAQVDVARPRPGRRRRGDSDAALKRAYGSAASAPSSACRVEAATRSRPGAAHSARRRRRRMRNGGPVPGADRRLRSGQGRFESRHAGFAAARRRAGAEHDREALRGHLVGGRHDPAADSMEIGGTADSCDDCADAVGRLRRLGSPARRLRRRRRRCVSMVRRAATPASDGALRTAAGRASPGSVNRLRLVRRHRPRSRTSATRASSRSTRLLPPGARGGARSSSGVTALERRSPTAPAPVSPCCGGRCRAMRRGAESRMRERRRTAASARTTTRFATSPFFAGVRTPVARRRSR